MVRNRTPRHLRRSRAAKGVVIVYRGAQSSRGCRKNGQPLRFVRRVGKAKRAHHSSGAVRANGGHGAEAPLPTLRTHFNASATLAIPALAQASSFSPPGAPETPTPPIGSLPARIGTPPPTPTTLGIWRRKALAGSSISFMVCSEVWLRVRAV